MGLNPCGSEIGGGRRRSDAGRGGIWASCCTPVEDERKRTEFHPCAGQHPEQLNRRRRRRRRKNNGRDGLGSKRSGEEEEVERFRTEDC